MTKGIQYAPLFHKYGVVTLIFAAATLGILICPSFAGAQEHSLNPEKPLSAHDAAGPKGADEDALFPLKREVWFQQQRAYPNAHIPPGAHWRALTQKQALAARQSAKLRAMNPQQAAEADPLSGVTWTADGPQPMVAYTGGPPYSGRATAIAIHPTDPNTIYLGTAGGGVWKTTDGGQIWTPLTDDQASLAIGAIAIDPNNPNTVFVGTGEPNFSIDSYYGQGLLKSTDAGATWTLIRTPFLTSYANGDTIPDFTAIAVQPGNSDVVLAANLTRGLYRSADGGATWTQVIDPGGIAGLTAVMFDVKNPSVAYAGYGGDFPTITGTVFKSTDSGQTWVAIDGSGANAVPVNTAVLRTALAEDAAGTTLYAGFAPFNGTAPGYLYSTTNGGATWTQLPLPSGADVLDYYRNAIAVVPTNSQVLYASGAALYESTDGGQTWIVINVGSPIYFDQHAFAFSPGGTQMYLADDGGIFVTSDPTDANPIFTSLNKTINTNTFYPGFSILPGQPNSLLAGSQDHGIGLYTGALAWPGGWNFCGDGGAAYVDPQGMYAYAHCEGAGSGANWMASPDASSSTSWIPAQSGISTSDRWPWVADIKGDPQNVSTVYTGTNHLYRSTNFAASWTSISPDLTAGSSTLTTIGISPTDSNTIYTGAGDGTVSVTTNALSGASATWATLSGLPNRSISKIIVQPDSPQDVYLTVSGFDSGHVFRSTNGGGSWTNISGDLPNTPVDSIVVDPDVANYIYVATDTGVYATVNGGTNWTPLGQGLPNVVVQDILMYEPTRTLRVITHGRGAWDAALPAVNGNPVPTATSLLPSSTTAGGAAFTLTVTGTNFVSTSTVQWNGSARATTFVSSAKLTAAILANDIATAGTASVTVVNPSPGGGTSNSLTFTINSPGPTWQQAPGSLSQISVGADGTVWGLNSAGQPFMFNPQTQTWQQAPGLLTQVTVASSGVVWGLNAAGQIYRYDPSTQGWDQIPGILSQIAVGSDGDVWGMNSSSQIYHFNAATQTWVQIPGALAQLAVGYDGAVWGLNASQQVYRFNPGTQNWQQVGGLLKRVAVGADGDVWGINSAGQTYHFNALSQQWQNTGASLKQIAVGSATNVWGIDAAGGVWCFNAQAQAWKQVPGQLAQIAVGENGAVWGLNSAQQVYQFVQPTQATQTFHPLAGSLAQIATGLDGAAWGIDGTQQVWHFNAPSQSWQQIPGGLSQIAVGFGGNVWGLNAAGQIWQFNPSTQSWNQISGSLAKIAVGADGSVWGLNNAGQIWRFNSSTQGFQQISGSLAKIAVGADGTVWGLNSAGQIFRFNPSTQGWDQIPGSLSQIAVGSANNVWGINAAGQVFRYDSQLQSWDSVPGILTSLAVAFDGTVWGVNSAQQVWRYNVQTQGWDSIAGQMSQISVGADAVVWGLNASGQTYQYW